MDKITATLRMYWQHLLAILVFVAAALRYIHLQQWEEYLVSFAFVAIGMMSVVASDEVASWTGRYGFTYDQWWEYPATWVKCFGAIALLGGTSQLFFQ